MAKKPRKAAAKTKAPAPRAAQPRKKRQPEAAAAPPPPPPAAALEQELLQLARGAAGTLQRVVVTVFVATALAGMAAGVWALRPVPTFSSDEVVSGSAFDVGFKVENRDSWFALANLKIVCVLAEVRASTIAPLSVEATNAQFQANGGLQPGEQATFTCPIRAALAPQDRDDRGIPQRAEIYFRSRYDVPLIGPLLGSLRITNDSERFILNTRLLPPRWTPKP
jgi:hypothetical protein